jgi:ABC-type oligopeptide transport system ATPase subunit
MGPTRKVFERPAHPYTQMLLTSVPHLSEKWGAGAAEAPTSLDDAADGPLRPIDDDHFVAT